MTRIKLTTMNPEWPWARQTPHGRGEWGDAKFIINKPGDADWWFVYDDLPTEETIECRAGQVVLITPEPPALKKHSRKFLAQFDWVITPDHDLPHPRKIYTQQGLPWHVGRVQAAGKNICFTKDYDELKSLWPIPKTKFVSVIASDKTSTPGHRARYDFVQALVQHFGERLEVFGWGGREIPDKWDGIAPFFYHIAIENCSQPDYWTEKLSDAFLAGAFPIYYGCPNILDYFPAESLEVIDIHKPATAIAQIEDILRRNPSRAESLHQARELVLDRYNLFALISGFANMHKSTPQVPQNRMLQPAAAFFLRPTILERVARRCLGKFS